MLKVCMSIPEDGGELKVRLSSQLLEGSIKVQYKPAKGTSFDKLAPTPRQRLLILCELVPYKSEQLADEITASDSVLRNRTPGRLCKVKSVQEESKHTLLPTQTTTQHPRRQNFSINSCIQVC